MPYCLNGADMLAPLRRLDQSSQSSTSERTGCQTLFLDDTHFAASA